MVSERSTWAAKRALLCTLRTVLVVLDEGQLVVCGWVDAALRSVVVFVIVVVCMPL